MSCCLMDYIQAPNIFNAVAGALEWCITNAGVKKSAVPLFR